MGNVEEESGEVGERGVSWVGGWLRVSFWFRRETNKFREGSKMAAGSRQQNRLDQYRSSGFRLSFLCVCH